ncbi:MAG: type II toxin-antitoxin system PemK/MazF family toxin [Eggerthellaceae bacterium]|nr:type II toxin-antitoxin system PemK/MazF family toxin [Eggerthellaceae bacterium]
MIFEQGDVVNINFDPSKRHEPAGRHYAVVISPWAINSMSSLTVLAPITSKNNGYPLHVAIGSNNPVYGYVQCEAIRAMDLDARIQKGSLEQVGQLDDETMKEVMAHVAAVVGL